MNSASLSSHPSPSHQHQQPQQQQQQTHQLRAVFKALDFLPKDGEEKIPLSVRARFIANSSDRVYLRIVVGEVAIQTEIFDAGTGDHIYRLEGIMPPFRTTRSPSTLVPLAIQAVDMANNVLEHEHVGHFKYWVNASGSSESRTRGSSISSLQPGSPFSPMHASRRASVSTVPSSPSTRRHRRVLRRRDVGDGPEDPNERVVIEYLTSLEDMGRNLSEEECQLGRRLVQFDCRLDGNHLKISCHPIRQEDYRDDERTMTISCIYRSSTNTTYFTSVDVIQLLQHLADERFKVEEKNRIRRNLEGFHPTTISKSRANLESFFMQIMEFPAPKPRNIEKDVKVFTWDNLGPAIDKIMSKYSIIDDREADDSPAMMQSPLPDVSLGLPYDSHTHHQTLYQPILGNYHASPAFETTSSQSSDGERPDFGYPAPPSSLQSSHHAQSSYHAAPHHSATQNLYHSPMDGAYSGFSLDYGRSTHPSVATHYM